jgi:hypothetical protein
VLLSLLGFSFGVGAGRREITTVAVGLLRSMERSGGRFGVAGFEIFRCCCCCAMEAASIEQLADEASEIVETNINLFFLFFVI